MDENGNDNSSSKCLAEFVSFLNLICFILISKQISRKQYNDGYYLDLYENINLPPIKSIKVISSNNTDVANLFSDESPIYKWKEKYFIFERIGLKYLNLTNKEKDYFEVGKDSSGNTLYSNEKVINFIEITNSPEPSIKKLNYSTMTLQIDSQTYLHYSNDYITGNVLVDIKIGVEKKPCDDKMKNYVLNISEYTCKDSDLDLGNTYKQLDEDIIKNYDNKAIDINQKIYLYSRTYIGIPEEYKIYNNLKGIKDFANKKSRVNRILYFISFFIDILCTCNFDFRAANSLNSFFFIFLLFFFNTLILMICPVIQITLLSIAINNYNKFNKFIFSKINHGIQKYYKKYIWFIKYDIVILTFELFLFIPNIIRLIIFIVIVFRLLYVVGEKVVDTVNEKLKKREERKQRIKKYKKEIEELEKNSDIPISRINAKRLLFFKEKFYDALTCPISLEIFTDPVIVSSGHTYEREYIKKVINDKNLDPLTRQPLNKIIIENNLVKKLVIEFKTGANFNENVFNKMIELLKCPLTHKIFHDPYLASIGNQGMTYERSYIEQYFLKNKKDPTFNKPFKGELIKNYVIQDMVNSLLEMNEKRKDYSISIDIANNIDEKKTNFLNTNDRINKDKEIISTNNNKI